MRVLKRILQVGLLIVCLFSLLSCSKPINGVGSSPSSEKATEVFMKKAEEKGLTEIKVKTLSNLGFAEQEILNLSSERIAEIFAPGTPLDGVGLFIPDENQLKELKKYGIDEKMSLILGNLGYKYDEMLCLSVKEIKFIFPNTELMENLEKRGYNDRVVKGLLAEGKSYKDVIKEALN